MPSQSVMNFHYECVGEGATATTYSYLREPRVVESGLTRGLQSGSFNYLENGNISLNERINYYYGNATNISNSTVTHDLEVEFKGDRGISEFFAKGFFGNNRWVSAWKKIRYEESDNIAQAARDGKPWVSHPSNQITVNAHAFMNTSDINRTDYQFRYNADVKNGVVDTKDATGWTNRSGSKRYDWEHESRVSGDDLAIVNELIDSEGEIPEAGLVGDWLPCCFKGTVPTIDQLDVPWPSAVVKSALRANTLLPTTQLSVVNANYPNLFPPGISVSSLAYRRAVANKHAVIGNIASTNKMMLLSTQIPYIPSISQAVSIYSSDSNATASAFYPESKNLKVGLVTYMPESQLGPLLNNTSHMIVPKSDCKDGGCEGYECIYTYDSGLASETVGAAAAVEVPVISIKNIDVTLEMATLDANETKRFNRANGTDGESLPAKRMLYLILVHNSGNLPLSDVVLTAELAKGIQYEASQYSEEGRGDLKANKNPDPPVEDLKTTVTWNLNTLNTGEIKAILLEAFVKKIVDDKGVSVKVKGKASDGEEVVDSDSAPSEQCGYKIPVGEGKGRPCIPYSKDDEKCKYQCPDWVNDYQGE